MWGGRESFTLGPTHQLGEHLERVGGEGQSLTDRGGCLCQEGHTASTAFAEGESIYRVQTYNPEIKSRWVGQHSEDMGRTLIIPTGTLLMSMLG